MPVRQPEALQEVLPAHRIFFDGSDRRHYDRE